MTVPKMEPRDKLGHESLGKIRDRAAHDCLNLGRPGALSRMVTALDSVRPVCWWYILLSVHHCLEPPFDNICTSRDSLAEPGSKLDRRSPRVRAVPAQGDRGNPAQLLLTMMILAIGKCSEYMFVYFSMWRSSALPHESSKMTSGGTCDASPILEGAFCSDVVLLFFGVWIRTESFTR